MSPQAPILPGFIPCITIHQPWAGAIVGGLKIHETRGWGTKYRGRLAIHASKAEFLPDHGIWPYIDGKPFHLRDHGLAPYRGAIVGFVDVVAVHPITQSYKDLQTAQEIALGDWRPGRMAWKLENPVSLKLPYPIGGKQGLWRIDADLAERILAGAWGKN